MQHILATGPVMLDVGDDFYRYRVLPGQFVAEDGSRGPQPDVCVVECERLGGGRPWRVAIKAACAVAVSQAIAAYARALEESGGERLMTRQPW